MRRLIGLLAVLGMLATIVGCKGQGVCDCFDDRDPCCYGPYSLYGPSGHPHMMGGPVPPAHQAEPLKVLPREVEKPKDGDKSKDSEKPKDGLETLLPVIE